MIYTDCADPSPVVTGVGALHRTLALGQEWELVPSAPSQPQPEPSAFFCPPLFPQRPALAPPGQRRSFPFQRPCHLQHTLVLFSLYIYFQIYIISARGKKHHKMVNRIFCVKTTWKFKFQTFSPRSKDVVFFSVFLLKIFPLFQLNHLVSEVGKEARGS